MAVLSPALYLQGLDWIMGSWDSHLPFDGWRMRYRVGHQARKAVDLQEEVKSLEDAKKILLIIL